MTIITTYLVRKGLPAAFVLLMVVFIIGVVCGSQLLATHSLPKVIPGNLWLLLLVAGIFSAIGNLAIFRATAISPNPGLVVTILGLQGGLVAVLAVWVLKDKLNLLQIVGMIIGLVAAAIIGWGSRTPNKAEPLQPNDQTPLIAKK